LPSSVGNVVVARGLNTQGPTNILSATSKGQKSRKEGTEERVVEDGLKKGRRT